MSAAAAQEKAADRAPNGDGADAPTETVSSKSFTYSEAITVVERDVEPDVENEKDTGETSTGLESGASVSDTVRAALLNNPQVQIAKSRLDAAEADRFAALGGMLPDVEISAAYADEDLRSNRLQTLQDRDGTTVGVTAIQPVSQGLSAFNRFRSARASLDEAGHFYESVRQQTAFAAARAHASVVLSREIVAHRVSNLALLTRQYEIVSRRQRAGAQGRTGVEQALARRAQAQVDLGEARTELARSETAYRRIVGHDAPAEITEDPYDASRAPENLAEAIELAQLANPSLGAGEAALEAARYSKDAARGDFAPRITLEGSYFQRFGADQALAGDDEEYQLVARLRLPIFNQGRNIAGLRSAKASEREARAALDETRLETEETVMRSWRQLAQAEFKRIAAEKGIEAAKQSVKGLQLEYEAGQRTVIDVLDGQRDLVLAEISLSQAEFDLRVSQYELAAATGAILQAFAVNDGPSPD
ncbi:MAG: TolC family protein [Pseudomonadota bacterium]